VRAAVAGGVARVCGQLGALLALAVVQAGLLLHEAAGQRVAPPGSWRCCPT
jgi:hypothetical protein